MAEEIYRALQKQLDTYSLGFPATESGIEIKILKRLFNEDHAKLFLDMSPKVESPEEIASRTGRDAAETAAQLKDMTEKGLLFTLTREGTFKYGTIPFVHGLFEFQVTRLDSEMASLVEEYFKEAFDGNMVKGAAAFLRTVPVNRSVDVVHNVAAFDDAFELLKSKDQIVVTDCICRKQKDAVGQGCEKPKEVCFMFGSMGQYYLDHNMGRKVSTDEAIRLLSDAQEAGLVTQPATAQNPGGMCNCCGDCCGVLRALNETPKPAEIVFSNYFASVDKELCTGCEICLDRCQMKAITMDDENLAELNLDRCIGCGLCVTTCPSEALQLVPKTGDQYKTPPAGNREQMMYMVQLRGLI